MTGPVTGAAGCVRRLLSPRGARRGRPVRRAAAQSEVAAGWQAGARRGLCPIQRFYILAPFSFERESPAQISEPALPRSAGTDITRLGLLTLSRARRRGRWGGQRPARCWGSPGAEKLWPRSAPGGDIPLAAHPAFSGTSTKARGYGERAGADGTSRAGLPEVVWSTCPLHCQAGSAPCPPVPGIHRIPPSAFGQKANSAGDSTEQSSWQLQASSAGLPNGSHLPAFRADVPKPSPALRHGGSIQAGSWQPQYHAALTSHSSPEELVEHPRLHLELPSLVVGNPRVWGWCQGGVENQISVMMALLSRGYRPAPHTCAVSHTKWLRQA